MNESAAVAVTGRLAQFPSGPPHRQSRVHRYFWIVIAAVAIVGVAAGASWWSFGSRDTVRYITVPVTRGPVARSVTATGTVNPELTIIVGTSVSGVIQEL